VSAEAAAADLPTTATNQNAEIEAAGGGDASSAAGDIVLAAAAGAAGATTTAEEQPRGEEQRGEVPVGLSLHQSLMSNRSVLLLST
jgi:hypothetical protein